MWYKILFATIVISLVAIFQITFLGNFNFYFANFNLVLGVLIFLLFMLDFQKVLFFAIISGLVMDIFSTLPFGVFLFTIFFSAVVAEKIINSFFTNRSFYSVLFLGIIVTLFFNLVFFSFGAVTVLFGRDEFYFVGNFWLGLFYQLINVLLILVALFGIVNLFSRKFKPNFIRS